MTEEYQVIVDGMPWIDSEGKDVFDRSLAYLIAEGCENKGYQDVRLERITR
jgi:hypothetical protein